MKKQRKRQFKAAIAYFAQLRTLMLLGHWRLDFSRELPDSPDAAASVHAMEVRNVAEIKLGEGWYGASPRQQRHYAVHELLHLHLVRLDYTTGDFEHVTDEYSWRLLWKAYHRQMELTVDGIADVLAPLLPLPPGEEKEEANNMEDAEPARRIPPGNYSAEVYELIQGAIESTDNTPRTARLRKALEAFGVDNRDALTRGVDDQVRAFCEAKGLPYVRSEIEGGVVTIWFDEGSSFSGRWPDMLDALSRIKVVKE